MLQMRYSFGGLFILGALLLLLLAPTGALAVPAAPDEFILSQPDGTVFKAYKWGDENMNGWEDENGFTIVFEPFMNRWTYAVPDPAGNLAGSSYVAGRDLPPAGLKQRLRPARRSSAPVMKTRKELSFKSRSSSTLSPSSSPIPGLSLVVPSTGTASVPVVLINFTDRTTTYTPANFNSLLFSSNAGNNSMKDYYEEVSYGAFTVAAGTPGILGWYTAANTHNHYGPQVREEAAGPYTGNLIYEAAAAADGAGVDFTQYDSDGDCYVDVLAVIHQGTGKEASTNMYDIWSHRWTLNSAQASGYMTLGGEYVSGQACPGHAGQFMKVNDYIIMPEKYQTGMSTMGVFAHEYGHSLGLPDLYDTDYFGAGAGRWSIMAGGSWNYVSRPGDRPAHMDAWSKYALGWVSPTLVTSPLTDAPVATAATTASVYQLLSGSPDVSGEYFLVENRQKVGFDAGLPGAGLLIWHIDESQSSMDNDCTTFPENWLGYWTWFNESEWHWNYSCSPGSHYQVAVVEADNRYQLEYGVCSSYIDSIGYLHITCSGNQGDGGDPFPGTTAKKWFAATSHRFNNSDLYNGGIGNTTPSNVVVGDISASGSVMTASMASAALPQIALTTALDDPTLGGPLVFTHGSPGGMADWYGQALISNFGGSAAKSGDIIDWMFSTMETTVSGPASLSFLWKVSSQPTYDYVSFKINGVEKAKISGEVNWQPKGFTLGAGTNTLTWTYKKNASLSQGMDAAWVDKVVVSSVTKVTVLSPNGGEAFASGSTQNISWDAPAAGEKYKLWYSLDNGATWKTITTDYVAGTSYSWVVPAQNGNKKTCKVKVTAYNGANAVVGTDISNAPFTIEVVKVNAPNGGQALATGETTTIEYTYNATVSAVTKVELAYTMDNGTTWKAITPAPTSFSQGANTYGWAVPVLSGNKSACKVKVTLKNAANAVVGTDTSDTNFIIAVANVNSPNGGESLASGATTTIDYTVNETVSDVGSVQLDYTVDNGTTWKLIKYFGYTPGTFTPGTETEVWSVPAQTANKTACKVKVTVKNAAGAVIGTDMSDTTFGIDVLKVTAPNGGETLTGGAATNITYTVNATLTPATSAVITYTTDGGVTWKVGPAGTVNAGANTVSWTTPTVTAAKTKCKVKVTLKNAQGAVVGIDMSDQFFRINP